MRRCSPCACGWRDCAFRWAGASAETAAARRGQSETCRAHNGMHHSRRIHTTTQQGGNTAVRHNAPPPPPTTAQVHLLLTGDPTEMAVSWAVEGSSCNPTTMGVAYGTDPNQCVAKGGGLQAASSGLRTRSRAGTACPHALSSTRAHAAWVTALHPAPCQLRAIGPVRPHGGNASTPPPLRHPQPEPAGLGDGLFLHRRGCVTGVCVCGGGGVLVSCAATPAAPGLPAQARASTTRS
jgi:hypothetical protein